MAKEPEAEGLGCESGDVVAEANQSKGAGNKKKNKWKTVTAEFYQPKPYEADLGKGKAGGTAKGPAGKGAGRGGEDFGVKGGRGGKGRTPQQDDERPPRLAPEEVAKPPPLDISPAETDAPGARGGGGESSPKRKPLGGKPRDAKGKGKSKQAAPRKGMGPAPFESGQDVDRPQRTPLALSSSQPATGPGQRPAQMQQMPQQGGPGMPQQFASFGGQGFSTGSVVYQNPQAMSAMYAMPYYVPVQMAPAQMAARSPAAIYTTSPAFVPSGTQSSGSGAGAAGTTGVPGVAQGDRTALRGQVQHQIEYYFDAENLLKDMYLRRNMSEEGWVALWLVAGFRRVQRMTTDMSLIVEAIRASSKIELDVQMQFVRPKDNWQQWVAGGGGAVASQREGPAGDPSGSAGGL